MIRIDAPRAVYDSQETPADGLTEGEETVFASRMVRILKGQRKRVTKHASRLVKGHAMFGDVCTGLLVVPVEFHI